MLDELRVSHGRLDEPVPVGGDGGTLRVELNHTDLSVLPAGFRLGRQRHAGSSRSRATWPPRATTSSWSPRTCRCGSRPRRSGWPPRSTAPSWPSSPAGPGWPSSRSTADDWTQLYDEASLDLAGGARAALPHRPRAAVRAGQRARPGDCRTSASGWCAATATRSGCAAGQRRAAGRARPAAGPRHRDRLARRPRRHRQVGAGAVRRPRSGARASPAPQGHRVPSAVRGRRAGTRLPARQRVGEDEPWGAGGVRHARRADHAGRHRRGRRPRHARGAAADPHPRTVAARRVRDRRRGAVAGAQRAADRAVACRRQTRASC